jgi:hypothetical protein
VKGSLVARSEIDAALERDMLALHARYFEGVTAHQFRRDLAEKDWAVLIRDEDGRLAGFSTLRVDRLRFRADPITLLSSGDTIVAPEAWHSSVLSRTWIESALRIHEHAPNGPLLWLLLSSGYRTYRFLPVFWREFFPRFDRATPRATRELMHDLARHRYGACFDSAAGVVRFPLPAVLRAPLRAVPGSRRIDPHVAFFLDANPGHERGDELVCLTELAEGNLTAAGRRMVGLSRRLEPAP